MLQLQENMLYYALYQYLFMEKQYRARMSFKIKIIFTTVLSTLWVLATIGEPPLKPDMSGFTLTDYRIDRIFETTLAIETKTFRKRIVQEDNGLYSYLPYLPYINGQKYVDLDITISTRIGFKLDGSSSMATLDEQTDNYNFKIMQPTILDRQGTARIVQKSDNYFSQWDIVEYDTKKMQLLDHLYEIESQLQLASFKQDPDKMGSLVRRLQSQLDSIGSVNRFSVRKWINVFNRKVTQVASQVFYMVTGVNTLQHPNREQLQYEPFYSKNQEIKLAQTANTDTKQKKSQQPGRFKSINYNQQESRLRDQMRRNKQNK